MGVLIFGVLCSSVTMARLSSTKFGLLFRVGNHFVRFSKRTDFCSRNHWSSRFNAGLLAGKSWPPVTDSTKVTVWACAFG